MNDFLKKRCADLTVLEILNLAHLKNKVEKPFIDMAQFSEVSGIDRNKIHRLLIHDLSGVRELVFGGYEKHQKYKAGRKLYFDTEKTLEWLNNRE
ncbi:hypothetical protein HZP59_08590 [Elizabethkingia anophelis]|nr:hypothetical protein [Elizabethkingia anophelis]